MNTTLGQIIQKYGARHNHFDIMRLIAALVVIFSHAFPLAHGKILGKQYEPLMILSRGQITLGGVAVFVFFVVSGFLITASYDKAPQLKSFCQKRLLRLYPGLIVAVALTVFVLGSLLSNLGWRDYLQQPETYSYLVNNLFFLRYQDSLPGVFANTPVPGFINGSLWTLKYEILAYGAVAVLGILGWLKGRFLAILFILNSAVNLLIQAQLTPDFIDWQSGFPFILKSFLELFPYFLAGAWIYLVKEKLPFNSTFALVALFAVCLALPIPGLLKPMLSIAGAYGVIYLAYYPGFKVINLHKLGDLSYGVYIYGWPLQQLVSLILFPEINWALNFLISLPLVLGAAWVSWHGIEKRALRFKGLTLFPRRRTSQSIESLGR
ncbi:MAG: acyltransferase family protein [Cyanobacteriota bacterium]|jgi:peptidoglycan/LPS O-acetylase OafA/YrhL